EHLVGFAEDGHGKPFGLGTLKRGATKGKGGGKRSASLPRMVPRLSLHGMALATYEPHKTTPTAPTVEGVFGLVPGAQRQIIETPFSQDARSVVLHPHVLATVAHALVPDVVDIHVAQQPTIQTVPLRVTSMSVVVRATPAE